MVFINDAFSQFNLNKNNNSPFNLNTNEGWGANAFLNATNSVFSYTKETATGNTITGSNNKNYSLDSALAFSEMALRKTDGNSGNADGKASVSEFNKQSGTSLGSILDVDKDGFVNRAELTSYYLLVDTLDGNLDGNINQNSSNIFNVLTKFAPDAIKNVLKDNNDKIKEADSKFKMTMPVVDGSKGPYNNNDKMGKYANLGQEAANLVQTNKLLYTDFEYADKTDLKTGLASMNGLLKIQDMNRDGKVSVYENRMYGGSAVDVNNDGFLNEGEMLAETMLMDKNSDGKITYEERLYHKNSSKTDDYSTKVKKVYDDNKISDLEKTFKMPDKTSTQTPDNNSAFIKLIMQLFKLLLGL